MDTSIKPGPKNDITDVPGIAIGAAHNDAVKTGVSVVLPADPAVCACDVRGGGPGSRETDLLDPSTLVETVDAIVLSGGSSYGLAAADSVASVLGARGRGFQLIPLPGVPPSPIVPSAILYDLANGGDKSWGETPPYAALGKEALENADTAEIKQGRIGAGFGAVAGDGDGGLGSASYDAGDGLVVGALMAVNSFGSLKMAGTDVFWAWPFEENEEFGGRRPPADWRGAPGLPPDTKLAAKPRANTTIGVVAVSASLSQAQACRVAVMAQDGLARAIRPVHAPTDGDIIFVLATGGAPCSDPLTLTRIGALAADCVARACARGVFASENTA